MSTALAGYGSAFRLALRRDRVKLPLWVLGIGAFTAYCSQALLLAAPHEADLAAMAGLMSGAAGVVLVGPGFGFDHPTHEALFAGAYGLYVTILAVCMSILLVMRHTRAEEESERLELLRSLPLSRQTPPAVAVSMLFLANVAAGLLSWAVLVTRFDPGSSLLFAAGVAATGVCVGGVALVAAQLTSQSRSATGISFLVLGIAFAVRGVGDVLAVSAEAGGGGSWLSWFSPLAWAQQTRVFVADRWWPLLCAVGAAAVLMLLAGLLQSRRDLGAGLIAERVGKSRAGQLLAGPFALAMRLQRGSIIAWSVAGALTGVAFGSLAHAVEDSLGSSSDPVILAALGGDPAQLVDGYLAVCLLFGVVLASCFAILAVQRLAAEEHSGRAELLLSLPLGRVRWGLSTLVTAVIGAVCILLATSLTTGISTAVVLGESAQLGRLTEAGLMYALPVVVIASIAFLGFSLRPTLVWIAWVVFGYGLCVSLLGGMLHLPDAMLQFSVFHHAGQPPLEWGRPGAMMLLGAGSLLVVLLANVRIQRRNLLS